MRGELSRRRREFLLQLAGVMALGSVPGRAGLAHIETGAGTNGVAVRLAALLQDQESARRVGREYLRQFPREGEVGWLLAAIWPDVPRAVEIAARTDLSRLGRRVAERLRADFEQGRVVNLRGWILARTECRLCALASLI